MISMRMHLELSGVVERVRCFSRCQVWGPHVVLGYLPLVFCALAQQNLASAGCAGTLVVGNVASSC